MIGYFRLYVQYSGPVKIGHRSSSANKCDVIRLIEQSQNLVAAIRISPCKKSIENDDEVKLGLCQELFLSYFGFKKFASQAKKIPSYGFARLLRNQGCRALGAKLLLSLLLGILSTAKKNAIACRKVTCLMRLVLRPDK